VPGAPLAAGPQVPAGQAAGPGYAQARPVHTGKVMPDGTTRYRTAGPLMLCWCWAAIAVFTVGDLLIQGHDRGIVAPLLVVALITGVIYAFAWRPRVTAGPDGITVVNPFRDYRIPWGAVRGVFLGDSVEVQCSRCAPKGDRTVYCWALFASRRSRARAGYQATARRTGRRSQIQGHSRLSDEAQKLASKTQSEIIAAELGRKATQAVADGHTEGFLAGRWAWQALAAILLPGLLLALVVLL
jgi:hypothetical protein